MSQWTISMGRKGEGSFELNSVDDEQDGSKGLFPSLQPVAGVVLLAEVVRSTLLFSTHAGSQNTSLGEYGVHSLLQLHWHHISPLPAVASCLDRPRLFWL